MPLHLFRSITFRIQPIVAVGLFLACLGGAQAQVYIGQTDLNDGSFTIGEYDFLTGAPVKSAVVPETSSASGFALEGRTRLFTSNSGTGAVGAYNVKTGAKIDASLAQLTASPQSGPILYDGSGHLYVSSSADATVRKYNATTGKLLQTISVSGASAQDVLVLGLDGNKNLLVADGKPTGTTTVISQYSLATGELVNANFITIGNSEGVGGMISDGGGRLFISRPGANAVSYYDAYNGGVVSNSFFPGLSTPTSLAMDKLGHLFILSAGTGTVGEYDAVIGTTVNAALITNTTAALRGLAVATPTFAGRYTAILPPPSDSALPQGYGEMSLTIKPNGNATLNGRLGDGSAVYAAGKLKGGTISTNIPLYKGKGSLSIYTTFQTKPDSDTDGSFNWEKPATPAGLYPAGFKTSVDFKAALFSPPALAAGTYTFTLADGGLLNPITHSLAISAANKVTVSDPSDDKLKVIINKTTGAFSGSFLLPGAKKPTPFKGIFQQKLQGAGYFLGSAAAGSVVITAPSAN